MRFTTGLIFASLAYNTVAAPTSEPAAKDNVKIEEASDVAARTPQTPPGLLENLSPDVASLLVALGLGGLAPSIAATLTTVGQGVKKREAAPPGLVENLSPDVAALLTALGLGGLAPSLAATLVCTQ